LALQPQNKKLDKLDKLAVSSPFAYRQVYPTAKL
jgi:hypothetical protein